MASHNIFRVLQSRVKMIVKLIFLRVLAYESVNPYLSNETSKYQLNNNSKFRFNKIEPGKPGLAGTGFAKSLKGIQSIASSCVRFSLFRSSFTQSIQALFGVFFFNFFLSPPFRAYYEKG